MQTATNAAILGPHVDERIMAEFCARFLVLVLRVSQTTYIPVRLSTIGTC